MNEEKVKEVVKNELMKDYELTFIDELPDSCYNLGYKNCYYILCTQKNTLIMQPSKVFVISKETDEVMATIKLLG